MFPDTTGHPTQPNRTIILNPDMHIILTFISLLCTIHSVASSLELNPMCSNWDEFSFVVDNVPIISDSSYTGNILLDIIVWIFFVFYFFLLRVTFIWPLITFLFFLISYRVTIRWKAKPWTECNKT
jgi:hypothetical protein